MDTGNISLSKLCLIISVWYYITPTELCIHISKIYCTYCDLYFIWNYKNVVLGLLQYIIISGYVKI